MENLVNYKDCTAEDSLRILALQSQPLDTLTDEELWILYTKAKDDPKEEQSEDCLSTYESELITRGILKS